MNIKSLTIAQRVQLLSNGLNDRSESVREVSANDLLGGWLKSFDGDVVKLLKCLDVEGCATVAELVVKTILKGIFSNSYRVGTLRHVPCHQCLSCHLLHLTVLTVLFQLLLTELTRNISPPAPLTDLCSYVHFFQCLGGS